MMRLLRFFDNNIKYLRWFDISLIKLSTAAFILMIAKLWTPLLTMEWYWYLIISLIATIRPIYQILKHSFSS